jgi:hypothetical protein
MILLPPVLDKFDWMQVYKSCVLSSIKVKQLLYTMKITFNDLVKDKSLHLFRILQELINIQFDMERQNRFRFYLITKLSNDLVLLF